MKGVLKKLELPVTPGAYARGYYEKLYRALRHWLDAEVPFRSPHDSNVEVPTSA